MAWNEPGNGGKDRDPWRNNNKDQGPPDLDDVFKKLTGKFGGLFGGKGGGGNDVSSLAITLVVLVGLLIWGFSGIYTVTEAERGVVLRFGAYNEQVEPGLHWNPKFIDKVIPVDVKSIRSMPASGFMLTQDENVVRVEMDVQYRVFEPEKYLFTVTNADDSLRQAMDSALRSVIGHSSMDDVLTTGREVVRQQTRELLEDIILPYDMGIEIVDVNFLPARPPEEVKDAFDDAISAQEDEERFVREAEAYERSKEPEARGRVKRMEQQAEAYKQEAILKSQGEVARFNALLPHYQANQDVTRERLYLETMEEVFKNSSKILLDSEGSGNMLYLPLDKIIQQSEQNRAPKSSSYSSPSRSIDSVNSTTNGSSSIRGERPRSGRG